MGQRSFSGGQGGGSRLASLTLQHFLDVKTLSQPSRHSTTKLESNSHFRLDDFERNQSTTKLHCFGLQIILFVETISLEQKTIENKKLCINHFMQ